MIELSASNTHLYAGAMLHLDAVPEEGGAHACQVAFADGAIAMGALTVADGLVLALSPYATGAGTEIGAKYWVLRPEPGGTLKVVGEAPDPHGA